ncbi:MAG: hypothetical protein ACP5E3_00670, partial [Bacteroidales bacterium]
IEEESGAITGFTEPTGVSDALQTDRLVNNTQDVHYIDYVFKPRIEATIEDDPYCERQDQFDTIRVYVQPFPQITVSVDRDTICSDETINFSITNDNGTYFGDWVYDITVDEELPGAITGFEEPVGINDLSFEDNLINNTPNVHWIDYIFKPRFENGSGDGPNCQRESEWDTIRVFVQPFPMINATVNYDTICSDETPTITVTNGNGSYFGTWVYDVEIREEEPGAILGANPQTGISNPLISEQLENVTENMHWIEYIFKPRIIDPSPEFSDCQKPQNYDTVRIYVQPFPQITVSVDRDTVCSDEAIYFNINNINEIFVGEFVYDISVNEEVPGAITGFDELTNETDAVQSDTLINNTADVHWIEYIFKPRFMDASETTLYCERQDDWDTVRIYVQPFPQITVDVDQDTVCSEDFVNFNITKDNGDVIGEWVYDVEVREEVEGAITGFNTLSTETALSQRDSLINTDNEVHWIEYIFKPRIIGGSADDANCERPQEYDTVRIYVQPYPQISIDELVNDTICTGEIVNFNINNENGNIFGSWVYDISVVEESPGAITGFEELTNVSDISQADTLINITDTGYWIKYIFKPHIIHGGNDCQKEAEWDTVQIWVNPRPQITIDPGISDTICFDEGISFNVARENGNVFGEWKYDVIITDSDDINSIVNESGAIRIEDPVYEQLNLTNIDTSVHWLDYSFIPRILDPESGVSDCSNGDTVTVRVYINPQPRIFVSYLPDTVLCDEDTITFNPVTGNGNVIGNWVYDVEITDASDLSAITGERVGPETDLNGLFTEYLRNITDTIQWLEYTFTPKIKDVSTSTDYCQNGVTRTIRVWLNPIPHLIATPEDTVYCDTSTVVINVENINGTVFGTKLYDVTVEYTTGAVESSYAPGGFDNTFPDQILDELVNNTDSLQIIRYIFVPKIYNPNGKDPSKYCDRNGIVDTVTIYLNPTPRISAFLNTDTVVCDTTDYQVALNGANPTYLGDPHYIIQTEILNG